MTEIIDLTSSPPPEIIEISSDQGSSPGDDIPVQRYNKRKSKKGRTSNGFPSGGVDGSVQPSKAHSQGARDKHSELNESTLLPRPASPPAQIFSSITDESALFIFDSTAGSIIVEDSSPSPEYVESNEDGNKLLLPSHVSILRDDGVVPPDIILPPKLSSDDEEYIEYLDYEDRKAPGLVRYFEVEGEESNQLKPAIFKCKKCGAEGDHKTYECPIQICLTCGARDEHSTRSCPISKTCYTCGMKGHINKTCPNRFSAHTVSSDFHSDCDRCGSTTHKMNECPTLWRIYQYVNDEERSMIMQSREERRQLVIGRGGEGYIGKEVWCYNCAHMGHLGDDCNELPHPATLPTEYSAFSFYTLMSGPFCDPAVEPISIKRRSRERNNEADRPHLSDEWNADAPADVGKRGRKKDKERLEKRFREQEDDGEDWFNDTRNVKKKGMDQQMRSSGPHGKALKFGLFKDGGRGHSSLPSSPTGTSGNGQGLLARLSDPHGGKKQGKTGHRYDRREQSNQSENSLRIRGAAIDPRNQDARYAHSRKAGSERGQDPQDSDQLGRHRGSRRGHGPRYRG